MNKILLLIVILFVNVTVNAVDEEFVSQLEQRINDLTDELERMNHKYDLLNNRLESLSKDYEFRLKEIEKGNNANIKTAQAVSDEAKTSKTVINPKNAKNDFQQAFNLLKEKKYEQAEQALTEFVKNYPNSEYTGNAYYWLAESFMLRKNYNKAAINYIYSFNKFPKNSKADLSMLKLAVALNATGKTKESCALLVKLKAKRASLTPAMQKLLETESSKIKCK
jgi:tol-pal system protein YbgF